MLFLLEKGGCNSGNEYHIVSEMWITESGADVIVPTVGKFRVEGNQRITNGTHEEDLEIRIFTRL